LDAEELFKELGWRSRDIKVYAGNEKDAEFPKEQ